ncbi:MAG: peptidylprolyl isomerase, partial [Chthoniobacterales bacterium]
MKISKDHAVLFDYEVRNSRSEVLDSSAKAGAPMAYVHGYASIIPGLEKALEGKAVGEQLTVVVPPVEAYGLRDERRRAEVSRVSSPAGAALRRGWRVRAARAGGAGTG